ncbi:MAG: ethanolamine ammonia-lyase subunit EutB, partial [Alphaproteobacteria bacterium]|nr:ethanolamine ammonia-lyase subunit EutB [Alphaproteobacteria bacterium]
MNSRRSLHLIADAGRMLALGLGALALVGCSEEPPKDAGGTAARAVPGATASIKKNAQPTPATQAQPARSGAGQQSSASGIAAELLKTHKPRNPIEAARNSTVFVDTGFGSGSGFFIDEQCTVVTNKHVIQMPFEDMKQLERDVRNLEYQLEAGVLSQQKRNHLTVALAEMKNALAGVQSSGMPKKISVSLVNGREIEARLAATSEQRDLAYLIIKESGCAPLKLSPDQNFPIGQKVFNPLPGSQIGSKGYMSARVQPNSPTDNIDDIVWQVFDAWSYTVGDLVLGTNPVSSEPSSVAKIEET